MCHLCRCLQIMERNHLVIHFSRKYSIFVIIWCTVFGTTTSCKYALRLLNIIHLRYIRIYLSRKSEPVGNIILKHKVRIWSIWYNLFLTKYNIHIFILYHDKLFFFSNKILSINLFKMHFLIKTKRCVQIKTAFCLATCNLVTQLRMESSLSSEGKISCVMIKLAGLFLMGRFKSHMGLLPDTENCGLCKCRECRKRFPHHRLQMKPLISELACITARASRTCRDACRDR